jgi:cytochrome c oxidase subunit 2
MNSVLQPAGPDAAVIAQFAWVLFTGGGMIFLAVMALLVLSLRGEGKPVREMRWIAGAGVAFPVVVLTALLAWSTWHSGKLSAQTSQQALHISVVGNMWWWEVRYRDPRSGADIASANEIHIPTGRAIYLGLSTADVIHSVWIPALNGKVDMIPGRVTGMTLQADRPGVYRGQCAEYCGEQHAGMALHVVAHTPQDFDAWLAREAMPAATPADATLAKGRQAFIDQRCAACHTIRGVAGGARLGPDLTHVGSRMHIAAGMLRNHRGTLAGWIADPQAIKPGARMPGAADMDGETLRALATYLEQLK